MTAAETPAIAATAGSLLGKTAVGWRAPEFGLSEAHRLVVTFGDGSAAFVKAATTDETAGWLRNEHRILEHLHGTGLGPEVLAWRDGVAQPLLVTEDLSAAYWPAAGIENQGGGTSTLWRPGDIDVLLRTLDRLRGVPLPPETARTSSWPGPQWPRIIEMADQLVEVGVVSPGGSRCMPRPSPPPTPKRTAWSSEDVWCTVTSAATTSASSARQASPKLASSTGRTPEPATRGTIWCSCSPRFTSRVARRPGSCAPNPRRSSPGLPGLHSSARA